MKTFLSVLVLIMHLMGSVSSQSSDVLVLKRKDGKRLASFMSGSSISLLEKSGIRYSGKILRIDHDTVLLETFDIRTIRSSMGGTLFDTVSRMSVRIDHRDIYSVSKPPRAFLYLRNGSLLKWSGIGYGVLHLMNAALTKEPVLAASMAAAGVVATTGYLVGKLNKDSYVLGRRYVWQYLDL